MKRLKANLMIIVVFVAYIFLIVSSNVYVQTVPVATVSGSEADKILRTKGAQIVELSDSNKDYFNLKYEKFTYNRNKNEIEIISYDGKSSELVIPSRIDGLKVRSIDKDFLNKANGYIKKLYIPLSVNSFDAELDKEVILCMSEKSSLYQNFKDAEWNIEILYDSDYVDYTLGDIPFNYNIKDGYVQITDYIGEDSLVVIPKAINGYPVEEVSFNMLEGYTGIVFPDSVQRITTDIRSYSYSSIFLVEVIFSLIAFCVSLTAINFVFARFKNKEEVVLNAPQVIMTILYLLLQIGFSVLTVFEIIVLPLIIVISVSIVFFIIYVVCVFAIQAGRSNANKVQEKIVENTELMREIKRYCGELLGNISDKETKKCVDRLCDEIRYSPMYSELDKRDIELDIQRNLKELKKLIDQDKSDEIIKKAEEIMALVKKRNVLNEH